MHTEVFNAFTELFEKHPAQAGEVLEIGPSGDSAQALISWFAAKPRFKCTGIDLQAEKHAVDGLPYRLMEMNANDLGAFADNTFSAVLCNSVLEHDRSFWLTLSEVRRVLKTNGLFFVGVPAYRIQRSISQRVAWRLSLSQRIARIPGTGSMRVLISPLTGTSTLCYHTAPQDYYRFSEDAVRDVFLEGMVVEELRYVLTPPRIIAVGRSAPPAEVSDGRA